MNNGNKHLVITWNNTFHIENLPNFIKENISKDLRDKYEVIHYNSGKCRATNEYIKYDSIIFLVSGLIIHFMQRDFLKY